MSKKEEKLKSYLRNQAIVYEQLLSSGITFLLENDIWTILQAELNIDYIEVIHANLAVEEILSIVHIHINRNGDTLGKLVFDIGEDDIEWILLASDDLEKASVRNNGKVWVVHQNDSDPHPSVPHAHNYQDNFKLNLYTGNLYKKMTHVGKMKEKELAELVKKIKRNFPDIKFED